MKKVSHWLDHSLRLGGNFYRIRWILKLGRIYNRLDFWNFLNPFSGDESEKMYRIRKIIEGYTE